MRRHLASLAFAVALSGLTPATGWAQTASNGSPMLSSEARRQALAAIEAEVGKDYVYPELRAAIVERLEASEKAGRYDARDPVEFARRVTKDFVEITKDSHLYLRYEPDWFQAANAPPNPGEAARQNAIEAEIAQMTNQGLIEMKVLPGNIRYLKIDGFDWIDGETGRAYDDAMHFLKGGGAVIIDLRGNGGGYTEASDYLVSHLLPADTLLATVYSPDKPPKQDRTDNYLPAGRLMGKPLYVLIDNGSRSAAEMVADTVRQYHLGELVGATTQGAAHISDDFAITPGFRLSIALGRTVQPVSGGDWEGVGVAPDFAVDPARALETAELHAVDKLLAITPEGITRNQLVWARPALAAALAPVVMAAKTLKSFAGAYGEASLRLRGEDLWLYRPDRDPHRLAAMTADGLFQAVDEPMLRVRVDRDGLEVLSIDPAFSRRYARR